MNIIVHLDGREYKVSVADIQNEEDFLLESYSINSLNESVIYNDKECDKKISITYSINSDNKNTKQTVYFYE